VSEDAVESKAESLSNFYCDRKDEMAYSHKIEQEVEGRGTGETLINVAGIVAGIRSGRVAKLGIVQEQRKEASRGYSEGWSVASRGASS
jgi:hypothetical protein